MQVSPSKGEKSVNKARNLNKSRCKKKVKLNLCPIEAIVLKERKKEQIATIIHSCVNRGKKKMLNRRKDFFLERFLATIDEQP